MAEGKSMWTANNIGERGDPSDGWMVRTLEFLKNVWDLERRDSQRNCERLFTSDTCFVIQLGQKALRGGTFLCFFVFPIYYFDDLT